MNKQFVRSLLLRGTIFLWEIVQGLRQPVRKGHISVELIDLRVCDRDGDLHATLPTPLLDIEDTRRSEGSSLHRLWSDKQGYTKLRRFWSMLDGHAAYCSMIVDLLAASLTAC